MEKPRLIPADYLRNNPFAETHKYKIYHDGYNYVATRVIRSKGKRPPKRPKDTAFDIAFDSLYFQAKRKGLAGDEMVDYIQAGLEKLYPASSTLRKYILEKIDKKQRNLWKRIQAVQTKSKYESLDTFRNVYLRSQKAYAREFYEEITQMLV